MPLVATVILPVFGFVLAGYALVKLNLLPERATRLIGGFVYWVAIPAILFRSMSVNLPHFGGKLEFLTAFYLGTLLLFAAGFVLARWYWRLHLAQQGVAAFSAAFGNVVQIGIPLTLAALGPAGLASHTLIVAFHALLLLSLATLVVEWGRAGGNGEARGFAHRFGAASRSMIINPVILSILLGLAWGNFGPALPRLVAGPIDGLAYVAGPAALFATGAGLTRFKLGDRLGQSLALGALKIVALPIVVWFIAAKLFDLEPLDVAVAVLAAGLPTGNNVFILAQRYRTYEGVSAATTILSTAGSAVTLSILIALLTG
jgi:malonate transporter and related proteins